VPWHLSHNHPECDGWAVVKDSDDSVAGCHKTKAEAQAQLAALYANERGGDMGKPKGWRDPPRDDLIRMVGRVKRPNVYAWPEMRSAVLLDEPNVMVGYSSVFNSWADIEDWEGTFRERFLPGAFDKTLRESGDKVKIMFNHGFDPWVGENILGVPRKIGPDDFGLWAEVPLLDTDYNRDRIRPQLEAGAIPGQSIRFSVMQERWNFDTDDEVPERSIAEAKLWEEGPVTWPAYEATTVGIRTRAQFDLWRSKAEAAPPPDEGRDTSKDADAPDDEGRDTSALDEVKARLLLLERGLDTEKEAIQRWAQPTS